MLVPFVWAPKQPNMPEPKNRPKRKRPLLEQTATGAGPGDLAWLKDGAQKVV